ncbi:MAG: glycoside hydrolase family 9 protein [Planctomycetia bacterium]|nr:glycoside hydrolase family 9 protein [Planctomycetia bacterium]
MSAYLAGILCAMAMGGPEAASSPAVANGSFEEGLQSPAGWELFEGCTWADGSRNLGKKRVHGEAKDGAVVGRSAAIELVPDLHYRLEGWVRAPSGEGRLAIELLDRAGDVGQLVEAPGVAAAKEWRYVAVEWKSSMRSGRVRLACKDAADFDDVAIVPVGLSYLGNKTLAADNRGRIGFWSEDKNDMLRDGKRGGEHRADPDARHRDEATLRLAPTGDWYAISSVNYPLPAWTDRVEFSAWGRAAAGANARILACWQDATQQVLRVDHSEPHTGDEWRPIGLAPEAAPAGAATVRLVLVASGGVAWFHDCDLILARPARAVAQVFANQVGYELAGPKSLVVASNFFPAHHSTIHCQIVTVDGGRTAWSGEAACAGRMHGGRPDDWGWYFWRVDFSDLAAAGAYRAVAKIGEVAAESPPFHVESGALLQRTARDAVDFFFVQRCGFDVPGWHKACHLDDANLADGRHVDVTGGWHSAGDYNKPMWVFGDGAAAYALARAHAGQRAVFGGHDRDRDGTSDALEEARWGAAFLAKMQKPDTGLLWGDVMQGPKRDWMRWTAPDVHTDNKVGTADDPVIAEADGNSPLTIAAWASLAGQAADARAKQDYLSRARRLWEGLTAADSAAGNPLLMFGAIELDRAAGDEQFHKFASRCAQQLLAAQRDNGSFAGDTGDHGDVAAAAVASFALAHPDDPLRPRAIGALDKYMAFCVARADNPFGLSRQGVKEGEPEFFHPSVGLGVNFWLLSRAWTALLIHKLTGDAQALVYATDQIDWVLGKNPLGLCMFEGHGALNPPRYHHRYNMIPGHERGAVPGAIPNGFVQDMGLADRPGFDMSRAGGRSPSFRTSEPWLVHNVFYLLAVGQLHEAVAREQK